MNLKDLFDTEVAVPFEIENHTITFHFHNPKAEDELEFRRRTTRQRIKDNGTIESSDVALKAPLWLFGKVCTKITLANGTGEPPVEQSKDQWSEIPENLKLEALATFRARVKRKESDDLRD